MQCFSSFLHKNLRFFNRSPMPVFSPKDGLGVKIAVFPILLIINTLCFIPISLLFQYVLFAHQLRLNGSAKGIILYAQRIAFAWQRLSFETVKALKREGE